MGICHLLPVRIQIKIKHRSINWVNDLDKKMKIIYTEQIMHLFLSVSVFVSFFFIIVICVDIFTDGTCPTDKDFRQIIHPPDKLPISSCLQYFFSFHHALSVSTHRSWPVMSLCNLLLPPWCLLPRYCAFWMSMNSWHAKQASNQIFSHQSHLCSHKLLLPQPLFLSLNYLKYLKNRELRCEFEMILKWWLVMFTLVSSIASISNLNESQFILYVSKTILYLFKGSLLMSIDMLRCDRWFCCF